MRQLALLAMFLGTPVLSLAQTTQTAKTNENSWDALNTLRAGERIEVFETNLKNHKGTFSAVTGEAIQLREGGPSDRGDMTVAIPRQNVLRVTLLEKSHRLRNALIFGAVGAGTGAGISAGATRCSTSTGSFNLCGVGNGVIIPASALLGLLAGAGIGAAIPSHPTIYRLEHA